MAKTKGARDNSSKTSNLQSVSIHSRPPLERMMEIHESVNRGNYPNASTLALKLEVSTKTIHRDIQFMRDRWNLPIEYDSSFNGFKYTRPVDSFPMLQINEGELFAILIAFATSFPLGILTAIYLEKLAKRNAFSDLKSHPRYHIMGVVHLHRNARKCILFS